MKEIVRPLEWIGGRAATPFGDYITAIRECSQCPDDYGQLYLSGLLIEERHGATDQEMQALATEHYLGLVAMVLQPDALTTLTAFTVAECRVASQGAIMHHAPYDRARDLIGKALGELVPDDIIQAWRNQRALIRRQALEAAQDAMYLVAPAKGGGWLAGKVVHSDPRDAMRAAVSMMQAK